MTSKTVLIYLISIAALSIFITVFVLLALDNTNTLPEAPKILSRLPEDITTPKSAFDIEFAESVRKVGIVRLAAKCSGYMDAFQIISEEEIKKKNQELSRYYIDFASENRENIDTNKIKNDAFILAIQKINDHAVEWIQNRFDFCTKIELKL